MPLGIQIDYRSLTRAEAGFRSAAAEMVSNVVLVRAGTEVILQFLRAEAPFRTGRLRASIISRAAGAQGSGFYGLGYGAMLAHGTRPHVIRPRKGRMLRFVYHGKVVFARVVHHPGTRPNDFPRRAVTKAEPALRVLMLENGRRVVQIIRSGSS